MLQETFPLKAGLTSKHTTARLIWQKRRKHGTGKKNDRVRKSGNISLQVKRTTQTVYLVLIHKLAAEA